LWTITHTIDIHYVYLERDKIICDICLKTIFLSFETEGVVRPIFIIDIFFEGLSLIIINIFYNNTHRYDICLTLIHKKQNDKYILMLDKFFIFTSLRVFFNW
jgi:hypothetical protein